MKPLLKVMIILALIFASTFILGRVFGILTVENIQLWLEQVQAIDLVWVFGLVLLLLFIDLFVAVPTLTITILAGFFLGFPLGAGAAFGGMTLAALGGYAISWRWGELGVKLLVKDAEQRNQLVDSFHRNGPVMILLSRAAPIVPEVTACMAGVTRMPLARFLLFFTISSAPYVAIAAYAGSISSIENPQPAIYAAIFICSTLWTGWWLFRRYEKNRASA